MLVPLFLLLAADRLTDPVEIVRKLATADRRNREVARQYTFISRSEERELDDRGKVTKTESTTKEVTFLHGRYYARKVARNDKPLTAAEAAKEDEKLRKEAAKRERESRDENSKLAQEQAKQQEQFRKLIDEIVKAYELKLEGIDQIDQREVYRISANPRGDYNRRMPPYSILKNLRGQMWVDCSEFQLVKVEADVVDNFSLGLVLARISAGTRLHFEQTRVNGEVWLPKFAAAKIDGRFGVFKKVRQESETTWKDFRKFSTESRIIETSEIK